MAARNSYGEEYFTRIMKYVHEPSRRCMQELIVKRAFDLKPFRETSWDVDRFLQANREKIVNRQYRMHKNAFFPPTGKVQLDTLDISLLSILILNACSLKPDLVNSLNEVKHIRNHISHPGCFSLTPAEYDSFKERCDRFIESSLNFIEDDTLSTEVRQDVAAIEKPIPSEIIKAYNVSKREQVCRIMALQGELEEFKEAYRRDIEKDSVHKTEHVSFMNCQKQDSYEIKDGVQRVNSEVAKAMVKLDKVLQKMDETTIPVPETKCTILVKHSDYEKEKQMSRAVVNLFNEVSDFSCENCQNVFEAIEAMRTTDYGPVSNGKVDCIQLNIHCQNLRNLRKFFDDVISGKIQELIKPLESALRTDFNSPDLELELIIDRVDFWRCIYETGEIIERKLQNDSNTGHVEGQAVEKKEHNDDPTASVIVDNNQQIPQFSEPNADVNDDECHTNDQDPSREEEAALSDEDSGFEFEEYDDDDKSYFKSINYVGPQITSSELELPEEGELVKTKIQFFAPFLEKNIDDIVEIIAILKKKKIINDVDEQEIMSLKLQRSTAHAVQCLLTRMQCHKRNAEWYFAFLCALRDTGNHYLANTLEPDFFEHTSGTKPKLGPIKHSKDTDVNEHVLEDKVIESDEESKKENIIASDYDSSDAEEEKPKPHSLELRDYQIELAEDAIKGRNTIICSETEPGKTWVALHIVASHLAAASNSPKKVVFMARTGVITKLQADRFKRYLPQYQTKLITRWEEDSQMIDLFLPNYDIMCLTPQVLENNLDSQNIETLSKFSLLVFDECHHTRGDEPYARLARRYLEEKGKQITGMPQIIGLTASVGVGTSRTVEDAVDYILHLCAKLDTTHLSTVERCKENLLKWVNKPEEEVVKMVTRVPDPGKDIMLDAMDTTESLLEDMAFLQPDLTNLMIEKKPAEKESQAYNKWTVDIERAAQLNVTDHEMARDISSCARYLNVYNSALEVNNFLQLKHVIKYLADKHNLEMQGKSKHTDQEKTLFQIMLDVQKKLSARAREKDTENPNVKIVSDQLRQMIQEKGDDSRAIVFVKARATCRALAEYIDSDLRENGFRAHPLYDQQTRGADEGMTESVQTETVEKFREGHYKVMVCTSVGTEGIDIPDCNIVVNCIYSGDEITKIQMKGRSRRDIGSK